MRKIFIVITLLIISFCQLYAKQRVSVLDFKAINVEQSLAEGVVDILTSSLIDSGVYIVIERDRIDDMISELSLQNSDDFDDGMAQEIGNLLGAEIIIIGSVTKIGSSITISVRGVSVETGVSQFSKKITVPGEDRIVPAIDQMVALVTGKSSDSGDYSIVEDFAYIVENDISRRLTGVWLGDSYEKIIHRLRNSKRVFRVLRKYYDLIILGTLEDIDNQAFTKFEFDDGELVAIWVVYDIEEDETIRVFDKAKVGFKKILGDNLLKTGEDRFETQFDSSILVLSRLEYNSDNFVIIQIAAADYFEDEQDFIGGFVHTPLYVETSTRQGFDVAVGGSIFYASPASMGFGIPLTFTFYNNRIFSAGFGFHSGISGLQLVDAPYGRIGNIFFSMYGRLKIGRPVNIARFILDIGINNGLYAGVILNKVLIQKFLGFAIAPFLTLGVEIRYKYFFFEPLFFIRAEKVERILGSLPVYDSGEDVFKSGIIIGIELRFGLLYMHKRK